MHPYQINRFIPTPACPNSSLPQHSLSLVVILSAAFAPFAIVRKIEKGPLRFSRDGTPNAQPTILETCHILTRGEELVPPVHTDALVLSFTAAPMEKPEVVLGCHPERSIRAFLPMRSRKTCSSHATERCPHRQSSPQPVILSASEGPLPPVRTAVLALDCLQRFEKPEVVLGCHPERSIRAFCECEVEGPAVLTRRKRCPHRQLSPRPVMLPASEGPLYSARILADQTPAFPAGK